MTRWRDVPEHLPIDDLPLDLPLDWSAQQALAAYAWLAHLRERLWLLYGADIEALVRDDIAPTGPPTGGNDDPPF